MFIWFVWNKFRITEVCRIVSCRHLFWSDKTFVLLVYCDIWHFELSVNCNYAAEPPKRQICYWHLQKCETTLPTQFFPALLPSHVWYQTLVTGFRFCYICTRLPFIRLPPLASYSTLWEKPSSYPSTPRQVDPTSTHFWPLAQKHLGNQRTARLQQAKSR